ncbi:hypothetical protein KNP414_04900 [Paenibacillus mucilaginosus KNP414]|uniref:Uncharacterized protein n=1 Tax=Paenibacillus mucilaginosus (strain KNP414) TaxID=1036673 RepID=F8FJU4_PAEMK|nr:hypothetical protein KNP414_04900 [Paenibacillus mucilaginosus KNP414]
MPLYQSALLYIVRERAACAGYVFRCAIGLNLLCHRPEPAVPQRGASSVPAAQKALP